MKIKDYYQRSVTKRVIDFLFAPKVVFSLGESRIFGLFTGLKNQLIAELFIFISASLVIYQQIMPHGIKSFAPWVALLGLLFIDKSKFKITKSTIWLIVFYLALLFSMMVAIGFGINPTMLLLGFLLWVQFGLFIFAGKGISSIRIYQFLTLIIAPIAIYGIYQFFTTKITTTLWVSEFEKISFRAFSVVQDPNVFGMLCAIGLICTIVFFLNRQRWYLVLAPFFAFAVAISYSRTAWLSLFVALLMIVFLKYRKYLLLAPLALLALLIPKVNERILVIFNPNFLRDSSVDGRIWILNNALYIWKQRPVLGFGPGTYGGQIALANASPVYFLGMQQGYVPIYYTDGQWVQTLVQVGILGVIALFGFLISALAEMYTFWHKNSNPMALGGMTILAFLLVAGFSSNIIEFGTLIIPISLMIGGALGEA